MKINRRRKKRFDISESGALSDLAFLLIIFFIVIAVFNINKGFLLGLPRKDSSKIVNTEEIIKISLDEQGRIIHNGSPISVPDLESLITKMIALKPNMTFLLRIAPETRYQDVVKVIEAVRKLEVENFSFVMEKSGQ